MKLNEYQKLAQRTSPCATIEDKLGNGALGITGEAGECADYIKKCKYQGHDFDPAHLAEEIGDVLWYCAELASAINIDLGLIAEANIAKLQHRYPDRFRTDLSTGRDVNGDEEALRNVLRGGDAK